MKFTNPWIDPRITEVRPEAAQAYLLAHGWKPLGLATNPDLLRFEGPGREEDSPLALLPKRLDEGPLLQRMIDLVAEVARNEGRWAVDVLTDMLSQRKMTVAVNGLLAPTPGDSEGSALADKE
jgi:hypothetical protein